nr:hypothetical protein [Neobacillus sp. Marseille-Q6967]
MSLFALLLLAGCAAGKGNNNETAYDLRDDRTNPNYMANNQATHNNYDEVRDVTDRNPNFLNLRGTTVGDEGEGNRNDFGNDIDKARDIVNRSKEFRAESIWINNAADRMTVRVDSTGSLSDEERNHAVGRLQQRLTQALPRYTFDIRER